MAQHNKRGSAPPIHSSSPSTSTALSPVVQQAQQYLEQNIRAWLAPKHRQGFLQTAAANTPSFQTQGDKLLTDHFYEVPDSSGSTETSNVGMQVSYSFPHSLAQADLSPMSGVQGTSYSSPCRAILETNKPSAAASFFARAAQRLNLQSPRKRKKHHLADKEMISSFRTSFAQTLRIAPPILPPNFLKTNPKRESCRLGKVKVLLRISGEDEGSKSSQFLTVDVRKKHVTLYDPSNSQDFRLSAHKIFAFDSVFTCEDSQADICSSSLSGVLEGVVTGLDGCVFVYGYPSVGKTFSMLGNSNSPQNLGVIPSAVSWLFKLIDEHKERTQSRFSVRVSAVEVSGRDEVIKDLLANFASGSEGSSPSPGMYLQEEVLFGSHLTELRAPNAEKAAFLLDAAIAARSVPATPEDRQNSHFCFTLNVYQYRAEQGSQVGVTGGRSRLHLLDLAGSVDQTNFSKDPNHPLSMTGLGSVLAALVNGQRHVPYKNSKLTNLLREAMGSSICRTTMIAHVSDSSEKYCETLSTIQLANRLHRIWRKRAKQYMPKACGVNNRDNGGVCKPCVKSDAVSEDDFPSGSSELDYTSGSEQSCVTAIFVGERSLKEDTTKMSPQKQNKSKVPAKSSSSTECPVSNKTKDQEATSLLSTNCLASSSKPNTSSSADTKNRTHKVAGKSSQCRNYSIIPFKMSVPKYCTKGESGVHRGSHLSAGCCLTDLQSSSTSAQYAGVQSPRRVNIKRRHLVSKVENRSPNRSSSQAKRENYVTSDEIWVDGPRFIKPKFDSRTLQQLQYEQWVDGPALHDHSKEYKNKMIKKWVQLHSHLQHHISESRQPEVWIDLPPTRNQFEIQICTKTAQTLGTRPKYSCDQSNTKSSGSQIVEDSSNKRMVNDSRVSQEVLISKKKEGDSKETVGLNCSEETTTSVEDADATESLESKTIFEKVQVTSDTPTWKSSQGSIRAEIDSTVDYLEAASSVDISETSDLQTSVSTDEEEQDWPIDQADECSETSDTDELPEMKDSCLQVKEEDILAAWLERNDFESLENYVIDEVPIKHSIFNVLRVSSAEHISDSVVANNDRLESISLPEEIRDDDDFLSDWRISRYHCSRHMNRNEVIKRTGELSFAVSSDVLASKLKRLTELRLQSQKLRNNNSVSGVSFCDTHKRQSTMLSPNQLYNIPVVSLQQSPSQDDIDIFDVLSVKSEPADLEMSIQPMNGLRLEAFYKELEHKFPPSDISLITHSSEKCNTSKEDIENIDQSSCSPNKNTLTSQMSISFLTSETRKCESCGDIITSDHVCKNVDVANQMRSIRQPDGSSNPILSNHPSVNNLLDYPSYSSKRFVSNPFLLRNSVLASLDEINATDSSSSKPREDNFPYNTKSSVTFPEKQRNILQKDNVCANQGCSKENRQLSISINSKSSKPNRKISSQISSISTLDSCTSHQGSTSVEHTFKKSKDVSGVNKQTQKVERHLKFTDETKTFGKSKYFQLPRSVSSTTEEISKSERSTKNRKSSLSVTNQIESTQNVSIAFPSPYSKITEAKRGRISSELSNLSSQALRSENGVPIIKARKDYHYSGNSSGYESMIRDSEGTVASSCSRDSENEDVGEKRRNTRKGSKKRLQGSNHRSRSAPARSTTFNTSRPQSPSPVSSQPRPLGGRHHRHGRRRRNTEEELGCTGLLCCRLMDLYSN
ncbi:kinesin-like protein KIF26B [Limulus polyphemus]|uniref:Kinesin-like protein KIF26B n=1 Tax=Limulus polyphemus TaxID=6850 RepID=A0ABM1TK94_LIMPO|nr:kinesin-like protein KIF26B [Limulus polyphemus]XP_022256303.1 kinesin-like protein KIF26B [Limulus polyphemus]